MEFTDDGAVSTQQIRLPFEYHPGPVYSAFLRALRDQRILGIRAGDRVLVPPRPFAPDGARIDDLVEVSDAGELVAWTVRREPPSDPRTFGLIHLDGADSTFLHRLDVADAELRIGLRVRARWSPESRPDIQAIEAFEPETAG